ncbi:MAG: hypothetical protein IKX28_02460 [Bacteroidales bacterium]|nr:hypothetical protein [Bacteroidales bacterium]
MRKYLFILLAALFLLPGGGALAQTVPAWEPGELVRKGTRIAVDSVKLDKAGTLALLEEAGGPRLAADWQKGVSLRHWGTGLTAGGFTLAAAGYLYSMAMVVGGAVATGLVAVGGEEAVQGVWDGMSPQISAGMAVAGVGLAAGLTGTGLLIAGNTRLRRIVKGCNEPAVPVELTFGPTPSGIGLALRF